MNEMEWTGKEGFNAAEFLQWKVDGKIAGSFKNFGNLTVGFSLSPVGGDLTWRSS